MKSAAAQMATHQKLVKITCSVEQLKKIVVKARNKDPDEIRWRAKTLDDGTYVPAWELVEDHHVAEFVNFANMLLYAGNATIKVVDKEPAQPKLVLPE